METKEFKSCLEINKGIINFLLIDFYPQEALQLKTKENQLGFNFAKGECNLKSGNYTNIILKSVDEYIIYCGVNTLFNDCLEKEKERRLYSAKNRIFRDSENTRMEHKNKRRFCLKYINKFYVYNNKQYQIIWAKEEKVTLYATYIEKPSNKIKEISSVNNFVRAKIKKPSGRYTELFILREEFFKKTFSDTPINI